ncbi:MAG: hypothetical protein JW770_01620 [Actinobacteria bacterium]|nr:hypothetical protein [Actinomycetota bacterium]
MTVTKDIPTIAKECGIKNHEPVTKEELADFLNNIVLSLRHFGFDIRQ